MSKRTINKTKQIFRISKQKNGKYKITNELTGKSIRGSFESVAEASAEIKRRVRADRERELEKVNVLARPKTTGNVYEDLGLVKNKNKTKKKVGPKNDDKPKRRTKKDKR